MNFIKNFTSKRMRREMSYIGIRKALTCRLFQRVLRVNGDVPWPVHWSSMVSHARNIKLAAWPPCPGLMPGVYIQAMNGIEIGSNVYIGPGVKIISGNHDFYDFKKHLPERAIKIGDNCWLGANSVILPGVHIGTHVIVAAGAVVTRDFTKNCVIGGLPAKKLREIGDYVGEPHNDLQPIIT